MRKSFFSAVVLAVLLLAGNSWADQLAVNSVITFEDGIGGGDGGQFKVYNGGAYLFETFCLENNPNSPEYIWWGSLGNSFRVDGINDYATLGGLAGATDGKDPLDNRTKWLYYNFWAGTLHDKVAAYSYGTEAGASELQQAIWFIEQESEGQDNYLVAAATSALLNRTEYAGLEYVKALNLKWAVNNQFAGLDGNAQDVLYVATPEPISMLLFGTGLAGVGGYLRRRFKK